MHTHARQRGVKNGTPDPAPLETFRGAPSPVAAPAPVAVIPEAAADAKPKRLNPIKQKQMEERCAFLEEEVPRVESALATTEQQLGVFISADETQRLSALAEELRAQLSAFTSEWEDLMMQLEEQSA